MNRVIEIEIIEKDERELTLSVGEGKVTRCEWYAWQYR